MLIMTFGFVKKVDGVILRLVKILESKASSSCTAVILFAPVLIKIGREYVLGYDEGEATSRLPNNRDVSGPTGLIDGIGSSLTGVGLEKDLLRARVSNPPAIKERMIIKMRVGLDMW